MLHRVHIPVPPVASVVESFTLVVDPQYPYAWEQVLPDGAVDLLISLGSDPHPAVLPGETEPRYYCAAWVSGIRRSPLAIGRAAHGYNIIIVRFRPGGASALFDLEMSQLTDRVVELDEIWRRSAVDALIERLAAKPTPQEKFRELEELLTIRLRTRDVPRLIRGAVSLLQTGGLGVGIRDIAATVGSSHTRLIQSFERHVGVKPKLLQRVLRFQRAIQLEAAECRLDWTTIAHRCGYYDQSHLVREFRHFAARSPGAYRAERAEYPNYIPVV